MTLASVQAQTTVTGNAKENFGSATVNGISEFKVDPVTLTFAKNDGATAPAYNKAGDCRIYAKGSITANCTAGNLTKIVFTVSAQGKKRLTDLTPSVGAVTIADDHSTITWEGNAAEVVMTVGDQAVYGTEGSSKAGQICFTDFEATYSTDGGATPDPEEPEGGDDNEEGEEGDDNEGEVTFSTIAEVIAAGAGEATTKGTAVATYARGFLLGDETGYILVYQGSDKGIAAGDAVTVSGATSMYGGLLQFGNTAVVEKTGTASVSHPAVTVMDGAAMDAYLASPATKYIEYTGTLTISGSYYNVAIEGASKAIGSIQYPKDGVVTAASGAVVKVTGYAIGVSSSKYVNTMTVKVEVVEAGEEPEEPETPTEVKEYTVTEALAAYVDGQQIPAIVKGYIVGAMNSTGYVPEFGATTVKTNILLADNADETEIANCIIVQLPSGSIRNELNLVDHADYYKKEIKITGSIEKYFQQAGLKNPTAYEFTGATGISEMKGENAEVKVIYDLTGRRVEAITTPGIYIVGGQKVLVKQ